MVGKTECARRPHGPIPRGQTPGEVPSRDLRQVIDKCQDPVKSLGATRSTSRAGAPDSRSAAGTTSATAHVSMSSSVSGAIRTATSPSTSTSLPPRPTSRATEQGVVVDTHDHLLPRFDLLLHEELAGRRVDPGDSRSARIVRTHPRLQRVSSPRPDAADIALVDSGKAPLTTTVHPSSPGPPRLVRVRTYVARATAMPYAASRAWASTAASQPSLARLTAAATSGRPGGRRVGSEAACPPDDPVGFPCDAASEGCVPRSPGMRTTGFAASRSAHGGPSRFMNTVTSGRRPPAELNREAMSSSARPRSE